MNIVNSKSNLILFINNKLRSLGIRTSHDGYGMLIKVIEYKVNNYNEFEFTNYDEIYKYISDSMKNTKTSKSIHASINYALNNRNVELSERNFEKIFGYEYDEEVFSNKEFIEQFVNMVIMSQM